MSGQEWPSLLKLRTQFAAPSAWPSPAVPQAGEGGWPSPKVGVAVSVVGKILPADCDHLHQDGEAGALIPRRQVIRQLASMVDGEQLFRARLAGLAHGFNSLYQQFRDRGVFLLAQRLATQRWFRAGLAIGDDSPTGAEHAAGTDFDIDAARDVAGRLEPMSCGDLVILQSEIPTFFQGNSLEAIPVGADAFGDLLTTSVAARSQVIAGRADAKKRGFQNARQGDIGGLMNSEDRAVIEEIAVKMDRTRQTFIVLQAVKERVDRGVSFFAQRLYDAVPGEIDAAWLAVLPGRNVSRS